MALYLKRLKGNRISVGDIAFYPITEARRTFNPVLRYLEEQYTEIAPRKSLVSFMNRDYDELSIDDDEEDTEENLMNSPEYWWNIDYLSEIERTISRFNQIVRGIKNGTLQKTDDRLDELSQVYGECTMALYNQYMKYCLFYESMLFYAGYQPPTWGLLGNSLELPKRKGGSFLDPERDTITVAGHSVWVVKDQFSDWNDKPYEWDNLEVGWTYWLNPFNWGDDDYDIKRKKQNSKWKNFIKHIREEGRDIGAFGIGDVMVHNMDMSARNRILNSIGR